jgi:hypothetical protein
VDVVALVVTTVMIGVLTAVMSVVMIGPTAKAEEEDTHHQEEGVVADVADVAPHLGWMSRVRYATKRVTPHRLLAAF